MGEKFNVKRAKSLARSRIKKHILLYVMVCLIATIIGAKYTGTLTVLSLLDSKQDVTDEEQQQQREKKLIFMVRELVRGGELDQRKYEEYIRREQEKEEKVRKSKPRVILGKVELGHQYGVLAQVYRVISTRSFITVVVLGLVKALFSARTAYRVGAIILLLAALVFFFFFVNVYRVLSSRVFMEGRVYDSVPLSRMAMPWRKKTWFKMAKSMMLLSVYRTLWLFTVVGAVIKFFSYFAVPYIIAENPDMSPKEAIRLSREMMEGHKWECFKMKMSFILLILLNILTLGMLGLFFLNPYREAVYSEYYAWLRSGAKKAHCHGIGGLKDTYLFEGAPENLLKKAYSEPIAYLCRCEEEAEKRKNAGFIERSFGVTKGKKYAERKYYNDVKIKDTLSEYRLSLEGRQYPELLSPYRLKGETVREDRLMNPYRKYNFSSLVMLFMVSSMIGWLWEGIFHIFYSGKFISRGILHGPWIPIYGVGGFLMLTILYRFRKRPVAEFFAAVVLCGIVEYFTGWVLEMAYNGCRWWTYDGYFLNIDGRVCTEGLALFGVGGMLIVYLLGPMVDTLAQRLSKRTVTVMCIAFVVVFAVDVLYSLMSPNTGEGVTTMLETAGALGSPAD